MINPEIIIKSNLRQNRITVTKDRVTLKFRTVEESIDHFDKYMKFVKKAQELDCKLSLRASIDESIGNKITFKTNNDTYKFTVTI